MKISPKYWIPLAVGFIVIVYFLPAFSFRKARGTRSAHPCGNNLRIIDGAKIAWAYTKQVTNEETQVDATDILPYIKGDSLPDCNWMGKNAYIIGTLGDESRCTVHGTTSKFRKPWREKIHDWWHRL